MKRVLLPWMRIGIFAFAYLQVTSEITNAQVTADDTVNTQVNQTDNVSEITGGETRGDNLFHSFQEFSVGAGNEAFFDNAEAIANIFSRVTGGDISNINGLISANGGANLFLINPAGISFGAGASLNIGGSFYGSTADSILLEDGEFSATDTENSPVLTINAPIGLGFRDNPGEIVNQSVTVNSLDQFGLGLQVLEGKSLALIGGDVRFDGGFVFAPGGKVELGGLSAAGTISFNDDGSFSFPEDVARSDVSLNNAAVDVSSNGGGSIRVNTNNLELSAGSFLAGGISVDSGSNDAQAGDIAIDATNAINLSQNSNIFNQVDENVVGNAGNININTNSLELNDGSQITSGIFGQGDGGNIVIDATGTVSFQGQNSQDNQRFPSGVVNNIASTGIGSAGDVEINASNLELNDGAQISSDQLGEGGGSAGNIDIGTQDSIFLNNAAIRSTNVGTGLAGTIKLNAPNEISIKNSTVAAEGNFGLIFIGDSVIPSQVTLEGERTETFEFSNSLNTASFNPDDSAGSIFINARDRISVVGTNIESSTQTTRPDRDPEDQEQTDDNFSTISLRIAEENPQGSINIERSQIDTTNSSNGGLAGFVNLDAPNEISIKDSQLFAGGSFGVITIGNSVQPSQVNLEGERTDTEDGTNFEFSNSLDTASLNSDDLAGRIRINARDRINVVGTDIQSSTVTTRTTDINDEEGLNFGVIRLSVDAENPLGSIAVERSRINTSNSSTGFAGNVDLNGREKIEISDSSIFSTGQVGAILFGESDLSGETSSPQEISIDGSRLEVSNRGVTVPENEDSQIDIDAGTISINATNNISIVNNSVVNTVTERTGNAGDLTIQVANSTVSFDNSIVFSNVEPGGFGSAGNINITANSIELINGSQLQSGTVRTSDDSIISGLGDGGDITLNARESITFSGRDPDDNLPSAIFTNIEGGTTGNAGNITVTADSLSLNDEAELNTESNGFTFDEQTSDAGKVEINADIIRLDGNSAISVRAFNGNNAGNLVINDAEFVIAYPSEGTGNDLFATSSGGKGGNVNLDVENLFGLAKGEAIDENGMPLANDSNDIDASSNVLGLDGTVNIDTSDFNPIQGTTELPSNVVEAKQATEQTCSVDRQTGTASGLTVQGRGGVQPSPDLPLSSQTILDNGKNIASESNETQAQAIAPVHTSQGDIIPAQGIVRTKDGRIILTAYPTDGNSRLPQGSANCTR